MKLIVCLDDKNGMLFNKRRQSSDRVVYQNIFSVIDGETLWMNEYSQKLFENMDADIRVDENFLEKAGQEDYCFVENIDLTQYMARTYSVTVFRWNRTYPADLHFPPFEGWTCVNASDFKGNSHERITMEVYER